MSLINCPECQKEVSDKAPTCPGCGAPIASLAAQPKKGESVPYTDQEANVLLSKKKKTNHVLHLLLSIITAGLWVLIWIIVALSNANENAKIDRKIAKGKKYSGGREEVPPEAEGWI